MFPTGERADFKLSQVTSEINRDDIVQVRTGSVAENGALLHFVSRVVVQHCGTTPTICVGFSFLLFITNSPCGEMMAWEMYKLFVSVLSEKPKATQIECSLAASLIFSISGDSTMREFKM